MESKVDYEDAFMELEIDITPELADELDGRCSWVVDYPKLKEIQDRKKQEQPGVDLERDAVQFCFDKGLNLTPYQAKTIAHHFYELGKSARKEE